MKTVIVTDSCCDLSRKYVDENNIEIMSLKVNVNGEEIPDDLGLTLSHKDFYDKVRAGAMPFTSQVNVYTFEECFKRNVKEGNSIIYIGFSSGLSGTFNSAQIAKQNIEEEYKDADITVIDSLSATCGFGLLVYYACEMLKSGINKDEIIKWVEENKLNVQHWVTVEDLNHLKRGGRISATTAIVGGMLSIKPIISVDNDGKLITVMKAKGRKKAIKVLFEKVKENIVDPEKQIVAIVHGDCIEEAEALKEMILNDVSVKDVIIYPLGTTIGAHTGPNTLALAYLGNGR